MAGCGHEPSPRLDDCEGSTGVVRGGSPDVGNGTELPIRDASVSVSIGGQSGPQVRSRQRRENSPAEDPIHDLYGEKRLSSPEIAPTHVGKSEPLHLKPIPDAPLTRFSDVEIDDCFGRGSQLLGR